MNWAVEKQQMMGYLYLDYTGLWTERPNRAGQERGGIELSSGLNPGTRRGN